MPTTFTWTISQMDYDTADGGVTGLHWQCIGDDGTNTAGSYGTVSLTPNPTAAKFVPYDQITEALAKGWLRSKLDKAEVEAGVQAALDELAAPTTATGLPAGF